jgi:hypothetical protein
VTDNFNNKRKGVKKAMYYNTYDKKIMEFDISKGWDAFIEIFTEEEKENIKQYMMRRYELNEDDIDYEWWITEYIKDWLIDNVNNLCHDGTQQLYNILFNM